MSEEEPIEIPDGIYSIEDFNVIWDPSDGELSIALKNGDPINETFDIVIDNAELMKVGVNNYIISELAKYKVNADKSAWFSSISVLDMAVLILAPTVSLFLPKSLSSKIRIFLGVNAANVLYLRRKYSRMFPQ